MTQQQRQAIAGMLRASPFDPAGDLREQRPLFEKMVTAAPVPADVVTIPGQLGGVPVIRVDIPGTTTDGVILYFHGGFFAIGSAAASVGLASDLAGPGDSIKTKADADPAVTADAVHVRARDYLGDADARDPAASPVYARLAGLPPLLIQAGSDEILVDDGIRLAARAADGDIVMAHGRSVGFGPKPMVGVDIYRVEDGRVAEHWDLLQEEVSPTSSGHPMFTVPGRG